MDTTEQAPGPPEMRRGDARTRGLPKAHLHLHLEHSIRASTFGELATREGVALDDFYHFTCLSDFLGRGPTITACVTRREDLRRICLEMVEDEARDGVLYVEPMVLLHRWVPRFGSLEEVFWLVRRALNDAQALFNVEIGLMIGFGRHRDSVATAEDLARFAAAHAADGVVAFGFGGDEALVGPEPFARACAMARDAGLLIVPHAGETTGPAGVIAALDALRPDRIAHGVGAAEDRRLLARLAAAGVVCDVCPTSNVRLGVVPSMEAHPVARLLDAGVPVTLNADDPLEFRATAAEEYARVRDVFALSDEQLARIAETSARASGASADTRLRILQGIQRWRAESPA